MIDIGGRGRGGGIQDVLLEKTGEIYSFMIDSFGGERTHIPFDLASRHCCVALFCHLCYLTSPLCRGAIHRPFVVVRALLAGAVAAAAIP